MNGFSLSTRAITVLSAWILCFMQVPVFGQWARTAPNTYLQNPTDNVGVGTSTPAAKLDVVSVFTAPGILNLQRWGVDDVRFNLRLRSEWNPEGIHYNFVQTFGTDSYNVLSFYKGNVGIGTNAPGARFEVATVLPAVGTYDNQYWSSGDPAYMLKLQQIWNPYGITQRFVQRFDGTDYPVLSFYAGRVGIGIDNPGTIDAKLAVKGTIHAHEVRVDLAGAIAPDYVFETSYNLWPLSDVEAYVQENKHLPEIPAGTDLEREGIKLREMNLLLLKKIEELTLYMISQDKLVAEQQQRLQVLENIVLKEGSK